MLPSAAYTDPSQVPFDDLESHRERAQLNLEAVRPKDCAHQPVQKFPHGGRVPHEWTK